MCHLVSANYQSHKKSSLNCQRLKNKLNMSLLICFHAQHTERQRLHPSMTKYFFIIQNLVVFWFFFSSFHWETLNCDALLNENLPQPGRNKADSFDKWNKWGIRPRRSRTVTGKTFPHWGRKGGIFTLISSLSLHTHFHTHTHSPVQCSVHTYSCQTPSAPVVRVYNSIKVSANDGTSETLWAVKSSQCVITVFK